MLLLRCRRRFLADVRTATTFAKTRVAHHYLHTLTPVADYLPSTMSTKDRHLPSTYLVVHMRQRVSSAAIRQLVLALSGLLC
jgi:hypothetical protein